MFLNLSAAIATLAVFSPQMAAAAYEGITFVAIALSLIATAIKLIMDYAGYTIIDFTTVLIPILTNVSINQPDVSSGPYLAMSGIIMQLIMPFLVFAILYTAVKLVFVSHSAQERSSAKNQLHNLVIGLILIPMSPHLYQLLIDANHAMTLQLLIDPAGTLMSIPGDHDLAGRVGTYVSEANEVKYVLLLCCAMVVSILAVTIIFLREMLVIFFGILMPLTIFLYLFDFSKSLGRKFLKYSITWALVPVIMSVWIIVAVVLMNQGMSDVLSNLSFTIVFMSMIVISPLIITGTLETMGAVFTSIGMLTGGAKGASMVAIGQIMQSDSAEGLVMAGLKVGAERFSGALSKATSGGQGGVPGMDGASGTGGGGPAPNLGGFMSGANAEESKGDIKDQLVKLGDESKGGSSLGKGIEAAGKAGGSTIEGGMDAAGEGQKAVGQATDAAGKLGAIPTLGASLAVGTSANTALQASGEATKATGKVLGAAIKMVSKAAGSIANVGMKMGMGLAKKGIQGAGKSLVKGLPNAVQTATKGLEGAAGTAVKASTTAATSGAKAAGGGIGRGLSAAVGKVGKAMEAVSSPSKALFAMADKANAAGKSAKGLKLAAGALNPLRAAGRGLQALAGKLPSGAGKLVGKAGEKLEGASGTVMKKSLKSAGKLGGNLAKGAGKLARDPDQAESSDDNLFAGAAKTLGEANKSKAAKKSQVTGQKEKGAFRKYMEGGGVVGMIGRGVAKADSIQKNYMSLRGLFGYAHRRIGSPLGKAANAIPSIANKRLFEGKGTMSKDANAFTRGLSAHLSRLTVGGSLKGLMTTGAIALGIGMGLSLTPFAALAPAAMALYAGKKLMQGTGVGAGLGQFMKENPNSKAFMQGFSTTGFKATGQALNQLQGAQLGWFIGGKAANMAVRAGTSLAKFTFATLPAMGAKTLMTGGLAPVVATGSALIHAPGRVGALGRGFREFDEAYRGTSTMANKEGATGTEAGKDRQKFFPEMEPEKTGEKAAGTEAGGSPETEGSSKPEAESMPKSTGAGDRQRWLPGMEPKKPAQSPDKDKQRWLPGMEPEEDGKKAEESPANASAAEGTTGSAAPDVKTGSPASAAGETPAEASDSGKKEDKGLKQQWLPGMGSDNLEGASGAGGQGGGFKEPEPAMEADKAKDTDKWQDLMSAMVSSSYTPHRRHKSAGKHMEEMLEDKDETPMQ
ncbi:MAG: hypothetical protein V1875_00550 [Candidatus Altiarchaeota archaeon]